MIAATITFVIRELQLISRFITVEFQSVYVRRAL